MMRNFNGCPNICHCHQRNIDSINLGQKKSIQEKKRVDLHNYPFTMCSSVLLMMLIWNVLPVILLWNIFWIAHFMAPSFKFTRLCYAMYDWVCALLQRALIVSLLWFPPSIVNLGDDSLWLSHTSFNMWFSAGRHSTTVFWLIDLFTSIYVLPFVCFVCVLVMIFLLWWKSHSQQLCFQVLLYLCWQPDYILGINK